MMDEKKVRNSILLSVKKSLGINPDMTQFDPDIIMCINSALNNLTQLGVKPANGFSISSDEEEWGQLIGDEQRLNLVKSYVFLKTKMIFDPPTIGGLLNAHQEQIKELEWRINAQVDPDYTFDEEN